MEEIQTIEENVEVLVAGVSSINGETGDVSLKTINGESIIGEGDLPIAGTGTVKSVNDVEPDANGNVTLTASDVNAQTPLTAGNNITISGDTISATDTTYTAGTGLELTGTQFSVDDTIATKTDLSSKQDSLSETQLNAVNSGIDSTKVGQIATNTSNITAIEGKIPSAASDQNQLADKSFVNSSVATNTANYISDNGEPFDSLADLEAYSGTLTNNDYAFVVGTDSAGNTTYTRYKYNATTGEWAEEYVLNNSSFTSTQWDAINSGITSGDVSKLTGLAEIKSIGTNLSLNSSTGELTATDTTYSAFVGTDGSTAGTAGLVPAPTTSDGGKYLKGDGTWGTVQAGPTVVQTTGTSQTDVMSQNATTSMVFDDPSDKTKVQIGLYSDVGVVPALTTDNVCIGHSAQANGAYTVSIGSSTKPQGSGSIAIGKNAKTTGAVAGVVVIGPDAGSTAGLSQGCVAVGAYSGKSAMSAGTFDIGSDNTSYGYNSTNYRLLTGVYDPQTAHDAATKGYVDGLVGDVASALNIINNGGNA